MGKDDGIDGAPVSGACHCGNISFTCQWPGAIADITKRRCGCSFCVKHGGAWTSNPKASLAVSIDDTDAVRRYRFGTSTADFLVCRTCGAVPVVLSEIADATYGIFNVNCLDLPEGMDLAEAATDFDGEATDDRLARRQRNWIPDVSVSVG